MSKYRPRSRRRKTKHRRRIDPLTRESVVMYREMGLTLREIANKTLVGYSTVEHILKKAKDDPELVKSARARMLDEVAQEAMQKAKEALTHITPDSMTHDRVVRRNAEGEITAVQHSGPTGQQIATTFGILADQGAKLADRASTIRGDGPKQLTPETVKQLIDSIGGKIQRIQLLDVDVDIDSLQARVANIQTELGYEDETEVEADYEVVDEDEGSEDT